MSPGTASGRLRELRDHVGRGSLTGNVIVDQVYAHYQDGGDPDAHGPPFPGTRVTWGTSMPSRLFKHPRGGEWGYLHKWTSDGRSDRMLKTIAGGVLDVNRPFSTYMADAVMYLCDTVYDRAPREHWLLRNSAAGEVYDQGLLVWMRPPLAPRASQSELNATRQIGLPALFDLLHGGQRQRQTSTGSVHAGGITPLDLLRRRAKH
jgi:hypothetical protein